ncbi:hypothetical protein Ddye_026838 [Dipteronia dyeriana]|uniref:DUF2921 domain-containing protein n=1 Tax=Dipteronia dyeriana TaxID=168575 RepID=A0AAD9TNF4_9ROSI|nr:hypothetical protein Ddye_026838 [Dipteronia dyeriana]
MAISSSLVWFNAFLLFLLISTHCIAAEISYREHCSSIVPESPITAPEFTSLPFPPFQKGYCDGGDRILNPKPSNYSRDNNKFQSFHLQTKNVFKTDLESVFKVEASLIFHIPITNYNGSFSTRQRSRRIDFSFKGFWSEYTGELCMVGLGNLLHLSGVKNSTITSLIRGTLSSVDDQSYFEPISILIFPEKNYQYTKTSNEFENVAESSTSLSLDMVRSICSVLAIPVNKFRLEYASDCNFAKTCNPSGVDHVGFLPQLMFLSPTECSPDGQSVRFFIEFPNSSSYDGFQINPFNPNTKFVGEGTWDWTKNSLNVVACRFTKKNTSLSNSQVGDCSIRMNLRFPAIWSIRNSISISGQIWSNKSVNDIGYFERIMFRSTDNNLLGVSGLVVRMSCSMKKPTKKSGENFPDGYSIEMSFYTSVGNSREEFASGYWNPISVGDQIFHGSSESSMPVSKSSLASSGLYANISYKISLILRYDARRIALFDISSSGSTRVEISAEGIYASLCMDWYGDLHGSDLQHTCLYLCDVSALVCEKTPWCSSFHFTSHACSPDSWSHDGYIAKL